MESDSSLPCLFHKRKIKKKKKQHPSSVVLSFAKNSDIRPISQIQIVQCNIFVPCSGAGSMNLCGNDLHLWLNSGSLPSGPHICMTLVLRSPPPVANKSLLVSVDRQHLSWSGDAVAHPYCCTTQVLQQKRATSGVY